MATDPNRLLREAEQHFVAGRLPQARAGVEQVLRAVPGHPGVLHLYGLILSRQGALAEARRALEAARRGLPRDPQVANNLGNVLRRLSEPEAALAAYDAALAAAPGFAPALLNRAIMLDELGRHAEAEAALETLASLGPLSPDALAVQASVARSRGDVPAAAAALDRALAADPNHALARRGRAWAALDLGEDDSDARFEAAWTATGDRDLLPGILAAARSPDARTAALARLEAALAQDPGWSEGQRVWATARWEAGEPATDHYERALAARPADVALWSGYADLLGRIDVHADAAIACLRAERATGDPAFAAAAYSFLSAAGDLAGAQALLSRLPAGAVSPLARAKNRLRARDPAAAEPLLAEVTDARPDDIEAWALRGIAWALLGDPRFEWLNGQPGLVSTRDLALDEADRARCVDWLRGLHAASTIRLGQSARGGTQTLGNLFDRREPEARMVADAIRAGVEAHRAGMPPADPTHPILQHRDAPLGFSASWSIRLTGGGFHVQHIHPKGIFSAASYWVVPEGEPEGDPMAGWLEIGGAPAYLALDLEPYARVEPKPGRLALFPSTLHHGTRAFPAGERMTVAFDVVARG